MFAKSTKVLVAALVLSGISLALVEPAAPQTAGASRPGRTTNNAFAQPTRGGDTTPKERHDPANTNGN